MALGLPGVFLVCLAIGIIGGEWLDNRFGTEPLFLVLGFILGAGAALLNLIRMAR